MSQSAPSIVVTLDAAVVTVTDDDPRSMTVTVDGQCALPSGPLDPARDRTLELAVRRYVREQASVELGYVEQLYTFGDRFRDPGERSGRPRLLSVGYIALVRPSLLAGETRAAWSAWYRFLPWEDWREGRPPSLDESIVPRLKEWVALAEGEERARRRERVETTFGSRRVAWNGRAVLERYELLYEVGLVEEAAPGTRVATGEGMALDHRRILATAIGRLRGKIRYRPVIFEVMPATFTLSQLQRTAEAIAGTRLHTQNFRRLVEENGLVEGTGRASRSARGRPAELYRFRREVLRERPDPGMPIPLSTR